MGNRLCKRWCLVSVIALCLLLLKVRLVVFQHSPNYNSTILEHTRPKSQPSKSSLLLVSASRASHSYEPKHASSDVCTGYVNDKEVVVVVKTGATEASRKLPSQLLSFLSCAKDDVFIFSDMEQYIGDLRVYDALDVIPEETKANNTEFALYEDQKQYVIEGGDIGGLSSRSREAWVMDKYKNIHTAQKVWKLRPNKSWYFFIDADTYIVWSSFFSWLKQLDANKELYIGAKAPTNHFQFAYGGGGYALSRAALQVLVGKDAKQIAYDYDVNAKNNCCGDVELGRSLLENNINITDAYPMINGGKPRRYKFGPRLWCQPVITMHHIQAEEMNDIWQFERSREDPTKPLLFEELFTAFLEHKLPARYTDWDELSEGLRSVTFPAEREDWETFSDDFIYEPRENNSLYDTASLVDPHLGAYKSIEECIKACKEKAECFQYVYSNQKCQLSTSFNLGEKRTPEGHTKKWKSGWDLDRIKKFKEENSPCKSVDYSFYR